jgi:hypothetical protein
MNRVKCILLVCLWLVAVQLWAAAVQPPSTPVRGDALVKAARSADEAWSVVTTFVSTRSRKGEKQVDPVDRDALSQADVYIQASEAAKEFNSVFPDDARKGEAKTLEVLYALRSVQAGASHYKAVATALATAYRADKKNSDRDRFDVAFLMDGIALAEALKGKRFIDDGVRYEGLADALHAELGATNEVYGLYVSIVRTTDVTTSLRVANNLLAAPATPQWVKSQAQTAVDRSKLIGKPLDLKLTTIGGGTVDLAQPHGRPTVIYFWHASAAPREFAALDRFKPSISVDARWLYVGLGSQAPTSDRPMASSAFAATHCFESAQRGNPSTSYL